MSGMTYNWHQSGRLIELEKKWGIQATRYLEVQHAHFAVWPFAAAAQSGYTMAQALDALWRWLPFLVTKGFVLNISVPTGQWEAGVIVEHGPPASFFTEAKDPRTREFLSQIL